MSLPVVSTALLGAALLSWPPGGAAVRARVRRLAAPDRRVSSGGSLSGSVPPAVAGGRAGRLPALVLPLAAGVAAALLLGGTGGWLSGLLVSAGTAELLRRGRGRPGNDLDRAVAAELPVACDLLAVCLSAGVPVGTALAAVGGSVAEPLRGELLHVAALHRLGAEPTRAWSGAPPALAPVGRALTRAGWSGSSIGAALRGLGADLRAAERARGEAAVRRAGVWVLAPLGACFLPAFVCLGVVPLVLGLASGVLG